MNIDMITVAIVLRSFLVEQEETYGCEEAVYGGMCCFDFYVPKSLEYWLILSEVFSKLSSQPLLREETRGKYSSGELEFLIKQKKGCIMSCESRRERAKFDVLSENRVQVRLRGCDLLPSD